jgi:hypothetical protein
MRPVATALISGTLGLLVGAATYGWVAARSLGAWNQVVQTQFAVEQEQRAVRAERQGDLLAALHHRWNVVDARSAGWLHQFETWEPPAPWFAFQFLMLEKLAESADPQGEGHRVDEGIARGQLGRLLEANGRPERGAREWTTAAELATRSDPKEARELVASLHEKEASPLHLQAEEAVLGTSAAGP